MVRFRIRSCDGSRPFHRPGDEQRAIATLDPRHAARSLPNSPSCGNQPAHISLTAVANDTLTRRRSKGADEAPPGRRHRSPNEVYEK
jgi:hypothetical protein